MPTCQWDANLPMVCTNLRMVRKVRVAKHQEEIFSFFTREEKAVRREMWPLFLSCFKNFCACVFFVKRPDAFSDLPIYLFVFCTAEEGFTLSPVLISAACGSWRLALPIHA